STCSRSLARGRDEIRRRRQCPEEPGDAVGPVQRNFLRRSQMVRKHWVSVGILGLGLCALGPVFAQSQNTCTFEVRTRSKVGYRGSARYFIKGDWVREEKRSGGGLELIMVSNQTGLFIRNKHSAYWFKYPGGSHNHLKDRLLGGPIGEVPKFLKSVHAK